MRLARTLAIVCAAIFAGSPDSGAVLAQPPVSGPPAVVAVLSEIGLPYFMADSGLGADRIVDGLRKCGIRAVGVSAAEVASPRFGPSRYAALVMPYGNTFPRGIAASVARFHAARGSIVSLGVPFTHPCDPAGPVGWSLNTDSPNVVARDSVGSHSGRHCLRIERSGSAASVWTGCISLRLPARPGDRFVMSAWVRTTGIFRDLDQIYVRFFGSGARFLGQSGPRVPDTTGSRWTHIRAKVTAPAGARTVDVCPALFTPGTLWLDDVALARVDSVTGPQLLPDGGFEGAVAGVWMDSGHSEAYRSHTATGAGEYHIEQGCDGWAAPGARRLLGLSPRDMGRPSSYPAVCVADFPGDIVEGIAGPTRGGRSIGWSSALIRHRCARFRGAIDLMASTQSPPADGALRTIVAGTARVLRERGLLSAPAMQRIQVSAAALAETPVPLVRLPSRPGTWSGVFPKPRPPARSLLLLDLESLAAPDKLTFSALQGLLNRPVPRVYADDEWSADMRGWGYDLTPVEPNDLLRKHLSSVSGVVVYDPALPASADIAVSLCGTRGWLPVQASQLDDIGPRGRQARLPIRMDLRGKWRTEAEAFTWALKHVRPQCTDRVLCHEKQMEPLTPDAASIGTTIVDYVVQQRIFCWHLNKAWTGPDRRVARDVLASYPANVPIIGHFGPEPNGAPNLANEGEVVDLASRYAKIWVFLVSRNTSVHAGMPTPALRQKHPAPPALDPTKVYVTAYLSDGDSPSTWYQGRTRWSDPARGTVPIAWSLGPAALELYPRPIQWFYEHTSDNDTWVAACSGAGYMYPHYYGANTTDRAGALRDYYRLTDEQMRRADLDVVHIHHHPAIDDTDVDRFVRGVPQVKAVLQDYGKVVADGAQANRLAVGRVPVFHAMTSFSKPPTGTQPEMWIREIAAATPTQRPAFIHFFAVVWFSTPTDVAQTRRALDPATYVAVRPDALGALYRASCWGERPSARQ